MNCSALENPEADVPGDQVGSPARQLERYRSIGFEVVRCDVGIGHGCYRRIPGLRSLERAKRPSY